MLGRIREWWGAQRQWRRRHVQAFAEVASSDPEGVTVFQRRLISAVGPWIASDSFKRVPTTDGTVYFVADVPGTSMQLYVYRNEAGLADSAKGGRLPDGWKPYEEWDFLTPNDLVNAVIRDLSGEHAV